MRVHSGSGYCRGHQRVTMHCLKTGRCVWDRQNLNRRTNCKRACRPTSVSLDTLFKSSTPFRFLHISTPPNTSREQYLSSKWTFPTFVQMFSPPSSSVINTRGPFSPRSLPGSMKMSPNVESVCSAAVSLKSRWGVTGGLEERPCSHL